MIVDNLIQDSYGLANIISDKTESVDAEQKLTGLMLLNSLISRINISGKIISLLSEESFKAIPNQETQVSEGWINVMQVDCMVGTLRQTIHLQSLADYFRSAPITNVSGIPDIGYVKRTATGIELKLYFAPSTDYTINIRGIKGIAQLKLSDEISVENSIYTSYLFNSLAKKLLGYFKLPGNSEINDEVLQIQEALFKIKPHGNTVILSYIGRASSMGTDYFQMSKNRPNDN